MRTPTNTLDGNNNHFGKKYKRNNIPILIPENTHTTIIAPQKF